MLGGWVNPHRDQQTIPQNQTSSPPKSVFTPTSKARPDQAALATSAEAREATHRARPRSPPRTTHHTHTAASMKRDRRKSLLAFTRYCHYQYDMAYIAIKHHAGLYRARHAGWPFLYLSIYLYLYLYIERSIYVSLYLHLHRCTRSASTYTKTRDGHYQYEMPYFAIRGRSDLLDCAIVWPMRGGTEDAQTKGGC